MKGERFSCSTIFALQNPKLIRNRTFFLFLIFRGEVVAYCSLKQVGIHLISPPGAVAEGSVSTVRRWNPRFRSPLLFDNEAVVSDVIELSLDSPGALHFYKALTLVIPHCASALNGYEVVVKCLSSGDEWKDVETADWRTKTGEKTMFSKFLEVHSDFFSMLIDLLHVVSNFSNHYATLMWRFDLRQRPVINSSRLSYRDPVTKFIYIITQVNLAF